MGFAAVQIVVHMIYFLHMNTKSEGGWTMLALIFTARAGRHHAGRLDLGHVPPEHQHDAARTTCSRCRDHALTPCRRRRARPRAAQPAAAAGVRCSLAALLRGAAFCRRSASGRCSGGLEARPDRARRAARRAPRRSPRRGRGTGRAQRAARRIPARRASAAATRTTWRRWCRPSPSSAAATGC